MSDDINQRGIDYLAPVWNIVDLTPGGRGDWHAGLGYAPCGNDQGNLGHGQVITGCAKLGKMVDQRGEPH